jgi:hypothetical protein
METQHGVAIVGILAADTEHGIHRGIVNVRHEDVCHSYLAGTSHHFREVVRKFGFEYM